MTRKEQILKYINESGPEGVSLSQLKLDWDLKSGYTSNLIKAFKEAGQIEKKKVPLKSDGKGGKTYEVVIVGLGDKPEHEGLDLKDMNDDTLNREGYEHRFTAKSDENVDYYKPVNIKPPDIVIKSGTTNLNINDDEAGKLYGDHLPDPTANNRSVGDLEKFTTEGLLAIMKELNPNLHRLFRGPWKGYTSQIVTVLNTHYKLG